MARYRLKDDGYPTFKWIYLGNERVGRVVKNADDTFKANIGKVEAQGQSEADAFQLVVADVLGMDISEISHDVLHMKKVQEQTQVILAWLADNAETNEGKLSFTNADLAKAVGKRKPDRFSGQMMSRLDYACYLAGLPPLGCAADKPFSQAWKAREGYNLSWDFPVDKMCQAAKAHRWTRADFDRIRHESQSLTAGMGHVVWKDGFAKHEARIKEWALGLA